MCENNYVKISRMSAIHFLPSKIIAFCYASKTYRISQIQFNSNFMAANKIDKLVQNNNTFDMPTTKRITVLKLNK